MVAHAWSIPIKKKSKPWRQLYFPIPLAGVGKCIKANDKGFVVGKEYRFRSTVESTMYPPYDVVRVMKDDYSIDDGNDVWLFINNHLDPFHKHFEIVEGKR